MTNSNHKPFKISKSLLRNETATYFWVLSIPAYSH